MIVVFAPVGGLLGEWVGYRWVLVSSAVGFALVAVGMGLTSFRRASFIR